MQKERKHSKHFLVLHKSQVRGLHFKVLHFRGLAPKSYEYKEPNQSAVFSGGTVVHSVPSRCDSVQSSPERSGAGGEAAGAAG